MVECQICKKTMEMVSWKHLLSHSLSLAEYKSQFPTAPLRSAAVIERKRDAAKRANAGRKGIPRSAAVKQKIIESKRQNPHEAWNKGIPKTVDQKQHLSNVKRRLYQEGTIVHWNTGRSTSDHTRQKISATLKSQNRIYSEDSKAKRKETMARKIAAGWVKRTTHELTPEHKELLQIARATRATQITQGAIDRASTICQTNEISIVGVSFGSYLYNLICNKCNHNYTRTRNAFVACKVDRLAYLCPICHPRTRFRSKAEQELADYISTQLPAGSTMVTNDRTILNGREIDCYIPNLNLGFEYNGLYWHAEGVSGRSPTDHNWKTKLAYTKGVHLVTIFEDEWIQKREIVKSRIRHLLKNNTQRVVYARKTVITPITSAQKDVFLDANHIQGTDKSSIKYGAWLDNELVAVMTITKTNMSKGGDGTVYELNRFAVARNMHIPGIASKLFARFVAEYNPEQVISYSDRRWCTGRVYDQLGFVFDSITPPSYWYLTNNYTKRTHRSAFMKHTLATKLPTFDATLTEWENMQNNGYDRIWDCGTAKFVYTRT